MTTAKLAGIAIALTAGQALAASNVGFTLQLGGDNHSAQWEAATPALYTEGNSADGQVLPAGSIISWGTTVSEGGVQAAGNGAGQPTYGVANFVFDLELHQGSATGPLATGAVFLSTINDGDGGDILAAASFALSFNLAGLGPGRVVDPQSGSPPPPGLRGGPNCGGTDTSADKLKSATYPTAAPGKLIGMGAGYNLWATSGSTKTNQGIGMVTLPNGGFGMGVKVLAEGQIDTTGLAVGTYVLKLNPGAGINVLRGDINLNTNQNAFATAADTTTGDTITFTLAPVCTGLALTPSPSNGSTINDPNQPMTWAPDPNSVSHDVYFGTSDPPPFVQNQASTSYSPGPLANGTYFWRVNEVLACGTSSTLGPVWSFTVTPAPLTAIQWRSIRTHGSGVGDQAIILNPAAVGIGTSGPTVETRIGGVQKIQIDFSGVVVFDDPPSLTITDDLGNQVFPDDDGMLPGPPYGDTGTTMEITFSPGVLQNGVCYKIDLAGSMSSLTGDTDCKFRNLVADVTGDGKVSIADQLSVKLKNSQPIPPNAKWDLNVSGTISVTDQLIAKTRNGGTACP